jgi:hypothetical protein
MIKHRKIRPAGHVARVGIQAMRTYFYFDNMKAGVHVAGLGAKGRIVILTRVSNTCLDVNRNQTARDRGIR